MDRLSDYDYELPPELIASHPLPRRDASRMLVLHRESGEIEHRQFTDFPSYLAPGDRVVLNNSRVIPARVFSTDGRFEFLFLEETAPLRWVCLCKPGKKLRIGTRCDLADTALTVTDVLPEGERVVTLDAPIDFERFGELPLPPYMHRHPDPGDSLRYQTVYAQPAGSVAAPTAGLHFTPEVLATIPHTFLTLHVGIGTFQPVKVENLADHRLHEERYAIEASAADAINTARRIVAVGTTSTRVLESQPPGPIVPHSGRTAIFIRPPFTFQRTAALLTNFHLPKSSLLMLVSAFAGRDRVLAAYQEAIDQRYRFFSYGDCMLIV